MGNSKSLYSKPQLLYYYIQRRQIQNIKDLLEKHPQIINEPVIKDTKQTALIRASYNGNLQMVNLFLFYKADPNYMTPKGETALTTTAKRGHQEIVQALIKGGANYMHVSQTGLRVIEYAILGGYYQIAQFIFNRMDLKQKQILQDPQTYKQIAKKYSYRYVNYEKMLEGLVLGTLPEQMPNLLKKQKTKLIDPVVDPRQNWKQWFKRQIQWKDAPLVERSVLPENLQPQNRVFGKVHHYTNNFMSTHLSQKTKLHPQVGHQYMSQLGEIKDKTSEAFKQEIHSEA